MKNIFSRGNLYSATLGGLIGTNVSYGINELMFWVVVLPILIIGILVYYKLEE